MDRRRFLELATVSSVIIAGCNSNQSENIADSSRASDSAGGDVSETTSSNSPTATPTESDKEKPSINQFAIETAMEPGRLHYEIIAEDSRGIIKAIIETQEEEINADFDGESEIELSGSIQAQPGVESPVKATIIDQGGNRTTNQKIRYARRYSNLDADNWNIGCAYDFGGGNWDCKAGDPTVGHYEHSFDEANRHLDQLTGHGVTRLLVQYNPDRGDGAEQQILESPLAKDIRFQYQFDIVRSLERGQLRDDLDGLRERLESIGSDYWATEADRPVISLKGVYAFGGKDGQSEQLAATVRESFDGFVGFMEEIRTKLEIEGMSPFLVADVGMSISQPSGSKHFLSWLESFDAISHPLWLHGNGPDYQSAIDTVQTIYRNHWIWATEHGLDFVPVVFPGFDNRANDCWETTSTYIERDSSSFLRALTVAAEYTTLDRVIVQSYNDWYNGTQIEAGRTDDREYGTSYLEAVGELQRMDRSQAERSIHYVGPDGLDSNPGTSEKPLRTIGHALYRAQPGDTVDVIPGRYHEVAHTMRPGTEAAPITITGPPDAVFIGGDLTQKPEPMEIMHSHVHVTGLTFDGLQKPDKPDEISSYAKANVSVDPIGRINEGEQPPYVTDVVIKPHAVGNTLGNCVHVFFGEDIEVGEFQVTGPAGVAHFVFDEPGHDGEIVYIGTSAKGWEGRWGGYVDRTKNVHVHHIDASGGYVHSEISDAKPGTSNVVVEYNTSVGAVSDPKTGGGTGLHLGGKDGVARWNIIRESSPTGILVGNYNKTYAEVPDAGKQNSVYGNRVSGTFEKFTEVSSTVRSIKITDEISEDDLTYYCGNEYEQPADGNPGKPCPGEVPQGDGVGHLGGDSPWD